MIPRKNVLALSLPAALALFAAAIVNQEPGATASTSALAEVGVVDLDKLLKGYAGAQAKEQEIMDMVRGFDERMASLRKEQEALELARAGLEEGTSEFLDADLQAKLKQLEFEKTAERFDLLARRKGADIRLELYDELNRGIAAFAMARGLKLVLRIRATDAADPRSVRVESNQAADVLFRDQAIDITDDVSQFLKTWK